MEITGVATNADGSFSGTFAVPGELHSLQGQGGGAVVAGIYQIASRPPYCMASFTVTAAAVLPGGGGRPMPPRGLMPGKVAAFAGLLLAVSGALAISVMPRKFRP